MGLARSRYGLLLLTLFTIPIVVELPVTASRVSKTGSTDSDIGPHARWCLAVESIRDMTADITRHRIAITASRDRLERVRRQMQNPRTELMRLAPLRYTLLWLQHQAGSASHYWTIATLEGGLLLARSHLNSAQQWVNAAETREWRHTCGNPRLHHACPMRMKLGELRLRC